MPRLLDLIDGYTARRRRTLRELGGVIALAVHDPKSLMRELSDPVVIEAPTSGPLALTTRPRRGEQ